MLKRICATLGLGLSLMTGASATTLTGTLTVDDAFNAYLSTSDSDVGTLLASSVNWMSPQSFSINLTPGTAYYLHIEAWDLYGSPSAFIGSFAFSDTGFAFSNGTQALATNLTDWKASLTGFGLNDGAVYLKGVNGDSPWGSVPGVAPGAQWVWAGPQGVKGQINYFSTTVAAVPEPEEYAMLLAGLGLIGIVMARRNPSAS